MEKISALMDGEMDGPEAREQIKRLRHDPALREGWQLFHLIGDVMRNERPLSSGFASRFASRFSREPPIVSPRRIVPAVSRRSLTFALSAAASLAAVAAVGWVALSTAPTAHPPQMAAVPAAAPAAVVALPVSSPASVPSDGTMNEYLMAHQAFSPSTEIQGLVPYIRSVSTSRQTQGR